jgi:hypothetical protein
MIRLYRKRMMYLPLRDPDLFFENPNRRERGSLEPSYGGIVQPFRH